MSRFLIAAALSIAGLAFVTGLAGCGDDSASETTQVEIADGVTISVPTDVGDQPPKEALATTLDSIADQVGFSDEWRNCLATELDAIPDARIDAIVDESSPGTTTQAALGFNAQISRVCGRKVAVVVKPDATSEQVDVLKGLTAVQLSQAFEGGQYTDEHITCIVDQYETLSNDQVVRFANFSARQSLRTIRGWLRDCA